MKKRQIVHYNGPTYDKIIDRIIYDVYHPNNLQKVKIPRSQPTTIAEYLEKLFSNYYNRDDNNDYQGYTDNQDIPFSPYNTADVIDDPYERMYGTSYVGEENGGLPTVDEIRSVRHIQREYDFFSPLYIVDCDNMVDISVSRHYLPNIMAVQSKIVAFLRHDLVTDNIKTIVSSIGMALEIRIINDISFYLVVSNNTNIYFGFHPAQKKLNFHCENNEIRVGYV
ncbi:hypothetical protein IJ096_02640 [Candidatus Saccharibacteria bacterium]|nr:hypothetical protein [Candidatus Saccharibacteria bacterium]